MSASTMKPIEGPCSWRGQDLVKSRRWIRELTPAHVAEIEAALMAVERRGLAWHEIRREDFPLPALAGLIADIHEELENGSGILKLCGVPVAHYGEEALQKLYFGLSVNLGTPVYQNRRGELMRFIRDEGADVGRRYGQIDGAQMAGGKTFLSSYARTLTSGGLRFHTDRTDVVGLLCVRQAAKGGVSLLCSSVAVMNEMLRWRPELAAVLFAPVFRSRHGEESETPDAVYQLPVFGVRDGRFTSHFSRTYIEAAQTVAGVPRLTDAQNEALELLLQIASELAFQMTLEPGDLQLINSHVTYHGRTPFEDDASTGRDRLLLRLWLSMPGSRALPEDHAVLWRNVAAGEVRGGIGQTVARE